MALSFACPACRVELQLPDELAGQAGQCPRCEALIEVPSAKQPTPVLLKVGNTPPVVAPPPTPRTSRPPVDDRTPSRARRTVPPPPRVPSGPVWPWLIGVAGGLVCAGLLIASVVVLFSGRSFDALSKKKDIHPQPFGIKEEKKGMVAQQGVRFGRLDGVRATMHNGVFQIRTELTQNDALDPEEIDSYSKRFEVELIAGRTYVVEHDSQFFDCLIRVENFNDQVLASNNNRFTRNAWAEYTPPNTGIYLIYATTPQQAFGPCTVTIRERNVPKPHVP